MSKVVPCRHGDVPVPELLDVEAAPVVQSAAVSHEAGLWQMDANGTWCSLWRFATSLAGQSGMLEGVDHCGPIFPNR